MPPNDTGRTGIGSSTGTMKGSYDLLVKDASCLHEYELPRGGTGAPSSPRLHKSWLSRHVTNRVTRWRACAVMVFCLMSIFLFLFSCLDANNVRKRIFCCNQDLSTRERAQMDYSYADYDADQEGSERIRYKHTKRRLPHCVIIGVRKCGTRALLEFLNLHPGVQAQKREMHFFDDDDNYSLGLEWYRKKMPYSFPDQITIEKTPAYFIEEKAPERIYHMNSSVKLLLVVRDPTERTISDYTQIHVNRLEKKKPHDAFENLVLDEDGNVRKSYNAVRRSLYHRHMENWLQWFPLKQIHVVSGEQLVKKPWEELARVESFLGIEHKLNSDHFYFNETRGFYCEKREKTGGKCLARSKGRIHPPVDPIVLEKLRDFYRPHNQIFYDQIGRDLGWP